MLNTHEVLRNQVTNLLNKANSLKDSYSFGEEMFFLGLAWEGGKMGSAGAVPTDMAAETSSCH